MKIGDARALLAQYPDDGELAIGVQGLGIVSAVLHPRIVGTDERWADPGELPGDGESVFLVAMKDPDWQRKRPKKRQDKPR